jgi:hypothetical protein
MRGVLLACLLVLAGCGSGLRATLRAPGPTPTAEVGRVIAGNSAPLPLPPGDWEQVYHFASGPYERLGFVLVDKDRAPVFVHMGRSVAATPEGYPVDPGCYPGPQMRVAAVDLNRGVRNAWDCMLVWPDVVPTDAAAHQDPRVALELQSLQRFGPRPKYIVGARIIAGYNGNFVFLDFDFFPEQDGVKGDTWVSDKVTPAEKAYIDDVVNWAAQFRRNVVAAAKGQLRG